MDYKDVNDYELIYYINDGKEEYKDILYKKYSALVSKYANYYYKRNRGIGIEYDDLYQEGLLALDVSLKEYDPDNTLFFTYTTICIKREMERIIKKAKRNKNMILSDAYSISTPISEYDGLCFGDSIPSEEKTEDIYLSDFYSMIFYLFKYEIDEGLSPIYELKLNNFSNKEIAMLLDLPYKKVDNSLVVIRRKFRKYLNREFYS